MHDTNNKINLPCILIARCTSPYETDWRQQFYVNVCNADRSSAKPMQGTHRSVLAMNLLTVSNGAKVADISSVLDGWLQRLR